MTRPTIFLTAMVAGVPGQGGLVWLAMQYALGFRRLGYDVVLVEPVEGEDPGSAAAFLRICGEFGLDEAAMLVTGTQQTVGLSYTRLLERAAAADTLVNVSGMLRDEALMERFERRIYLDIDPAFNQLWHAVDGIDMGFDGHTHFATVGPDIGTAHTRVPSCDRAWIGTLQPVVLGRWPVAGEMQLDALTTVANWRGYGSVAHEGVFYGQKVHSLRGLIDLPCRTDKRFVLALSIHPDERPDLEALDANRWERIDPSKVSGTAADYQHFVQGSRAEIGIAKAGYVEADCGWFSDRSACYLASGRPVLAQDTGFGRHLPVGQGLLSFRDIDEALAGIDALWTDYEAHRRAAREIAEDHFDSDKVLRRLLELTGGLA